MTDMQTETNMPTVQEPVIDITGTKGVEITPEAGTVEVPPDQTEPASATDVSGKDETPPWLKAEITKERNRRRAAEEQAQKLAEQVDRLTKAIEPKQQDKTSDRPKREDFFDPDEYDVALIEFASAEAERRLEAKLSQSREQQARETQVTQMQKTWAEQVETAKAKHADFEEVVYADDFQCSPAMMQALVEEKHGAEVAYHLATNPDENARIVALSPIRQAMEIGKLAVTLNKPAPVSKAPPPIKPLGTQAPAVNKSAAEESEAEYFTRRSAEARANKERMY